MSTTFSLEAQAGRLRGDVEAICFPEGRVVGSDGHEQARSILAGRLAETGCIPFQGDTFDLPYERGGIPFCNLESRCLREAFGPVLPLLLQASGLSDLATRGDMDTLVAFLRSTGL